MFALTDPSDATVRRRLPSGTNAPLAYAEVGMTRDATDPNGSRFRVPRGYRADHHRERLGQGSEAFTRAREAMERWAMFDGFGWLRLVHVAPTTGKPTEGTVVGVVARHLGFYSVNGCRVVYTVDEPNRFGFAYGTLHGHAERGEERFLVERRSAENDVWFDLFALSRPGPLAMLAAPMARRLQQRFARDAQAAMLRAVV